MFNNKPKLEFLKRKLDRQEEEIDLAQKKYLETQMQIDELEGHWRFVVFDNRNLDVEANDDTYIRIRLRAVIDALNTLGYEVKPK